MDASLRRSPEWLRKDAEERRRSCLGWEKFFRKTLWVVLVLTALAAAYELTKPDPRAQAILCIAKNVYHESRAEPEAGQYAVAVVTDRRAKANRRYWGGKTICGVVYHSRVVKRADGATVEVAEFSWTLEAVAKMSVKDIERQDKPSWERAKRIATEVIDGKYKPAAGFLEQARFYMNPRTAKKSNVCWFKKNLVLAGIIGLHDFYREPTASEKQGLVRSNPLECQQTKPAEPAKKAKALNFKPPPPKK